MTTLEKSNSVTPSKQFEKTLSGIKDVDLKILSELDDETLLNFCITSQYGKQLCKDESFWRNRLIKQYPDSVSFKNPERTWKSWYLNLTYFLNKYGNNFLTIEYPEKEIGMIERVAQGGIKNSDLITYFRQTFLSNLTMDEFIRRVRKKRSLMNAILGSLKANDDNRLMEYLVSIGQAEKINKWDNVIYVLAEMGNLQLVKYFVSLSPLSVQDNSAFVYAVKGGHKDVVEYFISNGVDDYKEGLRIARKYGRKNLVDFFLSLGARD
jgi:ankyrin repeat protein